MRWVAWVLTALTATLAVVTVAFAYVNDGTPLAADEGEEIVSFAGEIAYSLNFVAFAALGGLLASRRPRNPIGWLLCLAPLSLGISGAVTGWYVRAFYAEPGSAAPPDALLWLANWIWVAGFPPLLTALLLLFPDGRLPARRWWPAGALVATTIGLLLFGYALAPGPLDDFPRVENPLGVAEGLTSAMLEAGHVGLLLSAIASAAALAWRFRRSRGVERQQLKWISTAAAVAVVALIANTVLDQAFGVITNFLLLPFLLALPAAATVAILRYRLYDLGRIVNRTLVYGAQSATPTSASCCCSGSRSASRTWRSRSRRWQSPRCSARRGRASRARSTGASTAGATTPRARWRPSAAGCATRSTSTRSRPSWWVSSARQSSPPT